MNEFSRSEKEIYDQRKKKLEQIQEIDSKSLPHAFTTSTTLSFIRREYKDLEPGAKTDVNVIVAGRVINHRSFGKLIFIDIQDNTEKIQLLIDKESIKKEAMKIIELLDVGDIIGCHGEVITTKKGELSVKISKVQLLNKALRGLPEKWHGLKDKETRFRNRYLDFISNSSAKNIILIRSIIVQVIRKYLDEKDFIEVETPILQPTPGGAIAKPFETHHNALGIDMYLRIAPELYLKRLVIGGFEKVFEIGRVFRNEGLDATHSPEFTMLESYEAYADMNDVMDMTEEMIKEVLSQIGHEDPLIFDTSQTEIFTEWKRKEMSELVSEKMEMDISFQSDAKKVKKLLEKKGIQLEADSIGLIIYELFERHIQDSLNSPVFVTGYPLEVSPFARKREGKELVTDRFELFMFGYEIANGFSELINSEEQSERLKEQAKKKAEGNEEAHVEDEDYVTAMQYGLPPTGGLGMGIDRIVMIVTNQQSIREVVAFPHMKPD
tara:strand:+ start:872 stop:2353 length:1482 start_codon:yes stop_codon:yes gene_type:complete